MATLAISATGGPRELAQQAIDLLGHLDISVNAAIKTHGNLETTDATALTASIALTCVLRFY